MDKQNHMIFKKKCDENQYYITELKIDYQLYTKI